MGDYDYDKLVRYMAERMAQYLELTKEERKRMRQERARSRPGWLVRWFGVLPLGIAHWSHTWRRRFRRSWRT
jgi:hypothetical protein